MWKKRIKIFALSLVSILALVVVLQNTESVETRIFTYSIVMPRAALLFITLLTGFVLGFGTAWLWERKKAATKTTETPASKTTSE